MDCPSQRACPEVNTFRQIRLRCMAGGTHPKATLHALTVDCCWVPLFCVSQRLGHSENIGWMDSFPSLLEPFMRHGLCSLRRNSTSQPFKSLKMIDFIPKSITTLFLGVWSQYIQRPFLEGAVTPVAFLSVCMSCPG